MSISELRSIRERWSDALGLIALVASLLLLPLGVESVRAEDESPAPAQEARAPEADEKTGPRAEEGRIEAAPRAVDPRRESRPGVVVLNTRGYNYGPDRPTVRPELPSPPAAPKDAAE